MYFYHPSLKKKYLSISSALGLTHPTVCAVMDHSGGGVEGLGGLGPASQEPVNHDRLF